jgi:chromosome transmission fidelity protein 4
MAIKVAEFYRLVGLQEKMTALKNERMETDRLEEEKDQRKKWGKHSTPITAPRNHVQDSSRRRFEDFPPPPSAIRKSLAPAKPVINNTRIGHDDVSSSSGWGTGNIVASVAAMRAEATDSSQWDQSFEGDASFSSTADGKRKRDEQDASELDFSAEGAVSKKRALPPLDTTQPSGTKPAKPRMSPSDSNLSHD